MLLKRLYKALNWKGKAVEKFLSPATVKSNKHMAQRQPAVLSWAMLPLSAGVVLPEAQWHKDHLHLKLITVPATLELYATPTPQMLLLAAADTSPAHLVPWLQKGRQRHHMNPN